MLEHGAHSHVEREIIENEDGRPRWWVRLILAVCGIALLAGAIAAWQMQDLFGGHWQMLLPWLVVGAILLGGAAIIESITSEIWVTIIGGIFVLLAAYIIAGRVTVQIDAAAHEAFVVDRFTGQVRICDAKLGCRELPGFDTVSGVSSHMAEQAKSAAVDAVRSTETKVEKDISAPAGKSDKH